MPSRRRSRNSRSQPSSPLQAARFARDWTGQEVCVRVHSVCAGHGRGACKLDISKLSDWERGVRRPSLRHIEALCEIYQRNAEDLGLITWKRQPAPEPQNDPETNAVQPGPAATAPEGVQQVQPGTFTHQQLVEWIYVSVATVVAEALQILQRHLTALDRVNQSPDVRD